MTDLFRALFLVRLERLQELEAALNEQEYLLLWDAPRFLKTFKRKVTTARRRIERLIPALLDDPLNRFLVALHTAGESLAVDGRPGTEAHAVQLDIELDEVCLYLRVCQALANSEKPLNIQELKAFMPPRGSRSGYRLGARQLQLLANARFIEAVKDEDGPYVRYRATDLGRELIRAIVG